MYFFAEILFVTVPKMKVSYLLDFSEEPWSEQRSKTNTQVAIERLYAQLCSVYACFICGGNMFCNSCKICNPMVFVMGFPFKLLGDASLQSVFHPFFPLPRLLFPGN